MKFNRYPNSRAEDLRKAAAVYFGVTPEQIMPGNGSGEWIKMLVSDLLERGSKLLLFDFDFFIYQRQAGFVNVETTFVRREKDGFISVDRVIEAINREKPDCFIFSNPHNPSGQGFEEEDVKRIIKACGDAVVIVDEAYMDFFGHSIIDFAVGTDNTIVLRTCSKAIGLAGVRLGFAIANPYLIDLINRIRSPYSVNTFAQIVGTIVFEEQDYIRQITDQVVKDRETLFEGLRALQSEYPTQFDVMPSTANFFFVHIKDSQEIDEALKEKGIKIRDFPEIGFSRITVGTHSENTSLLSVLSLLFKDRKE
jgi:histidinol-phosphate aminotransferase